MRSSSFSLVGGSRVTAESCLMGDNWINNVTGKSTKKYYCLKYWGE